MGKPPEATNNLPMASGKPGEHFELCAAAVVGSRHELIEQRYATVLKDPVFGMLEREIEKRCFHRVQRLIELPLDCGQSRVTGQGVERECFRARPEEVPGELIEHEHQRQCTPGLRLPVVQRAPGRAVRQIAEAGPNALVKSRVAREPTARCGGQRFRRVQRVAKPERQDRFGNGSDVLQPPPVRPAGFGLAWAALSPPPGPVLRSARAVLRTFAGRDEQLAGVVGNPGGVPHASRHDDIAARLRQRHRPIAVFRVEHEGCGSGQKRHYFVAGRVDSQVGQSSSKSWTAISQWPLKAWKRRSSSS